MLLKNELSLAFLRNTDNLVAAVKSAVRIYAAEDENERKGEEECEKKLLEKILENQENVHDSESDEEGMQEKNDFSPDAKEEAQQAIFEKIINKLLEFNEKINSGKEISLVEYMKRIDMKSTFMQQFQNQRLLRRCFFEEFKIHSFNFILLLFESVIRLLSTMNMDIEEEEQEKQRNAEAKKKKNKDGKVDEETAYYSRNYRRFLEQRAKKVD